MSDNAKRAEKLRTVRPGIVERLDRLEVMLLLLMARPHGYDWSGRCEQLALDIHMERAARGLNPPQLGGDVSAM